MPNANKYYLKRVEINRINPPVRWIKAAVEILQAGGVIVYPTDSRYGLGCDIFQKNAVERIYQLKKRDFRHPLSFIFPDLKNLSKYANISTPKYKILKRCLPGPFTFILEATHEIPKITLAKQRTLGIRIPDDPVVLTLTSALNNPILNSSVPTNSEEEPNNPEKIEEHIGHAVDLILDVGIIISEPSTVVDLTGEEPVIVRAGKGDTALIY
jgi:tRNA threonylcarbamoyl adenosine modification protein (Sua5/YciO/YrdC/YwlC family)